MNAVSDWLRHAIQRDITKQEDMMLDQCHFGDGRLLLTINKGTQPMVTNPKYRVFTNAKGEYFHDACMEGDEHVGFEEVDLNELPVDAECEECTGVFLAPPEEADDEDDEDEKDS